MSDAKYSIDDILKEAARIRAGGKFKYSSSSPDENSGEERALKPAERTSVAVTTKSSDGTKRETIVKVIKQGKEQPITKKENAVAGQPPVFKPFPKSGGVPAEETAHGENSKTIIEQIAEKKQQYAPKTALPNETPAERKASFSTPDANEQAKTQIIDSEYLKRIVPKPMKEKNNPYTNANPAQTIVIDPNELRAKSEFKAIKNVETVKTSLEKGDTGSLPAIGKDVDYAHRFGSFTKVETQREAVKRRHEKTREMPRGGTFIKSPSGSKSEKVFPTEPVLVEKPAVMKGKMKFQNTADLQAIPEIISVDEFRSSAEKHPAERFAQVQEDEFEGQMKLDGVDSDIADVPAIDETFAEEELIGRRKEKIEKFSLFGDEKVPEDEKTDFYEFESNVQHHREKLDDYDKPADKESIRENLDSKKKKLTVRTLATAVMAALSIAVCVIEYTEMMPSVFGDTYVALGIQSVLLAVALLFNLVTLKNGIFSLFKGKPDSDFPVTVAGAAVIGQLIYAFINIDIVAQALPVYPGVVIFALLCNDLGKSVLIKRIIDNFDFITRDNDMFTVEDIENQKDAADICRGLLMGDPVVKHSVRTKFTSDFLKIAYAQEPGDVLSRRLAPFTVLMAAAIGAACYFLNKDIAQSVTAAVCGLCIGVPVISLLASNISLLSTSSRLAAKGAMINGFESAEKMNDANAIIFDASDLFPAGSCNIHGIKTFGGMRMDDAILQTAAVVIGTNGPLKDVFDNVIVGKQAILPEVDTVVYEDRMGTSAWIYGKKVLVGNRELMLQHGVKMPGAEFEAKYRHDNRYLLYLTVAGRVAAMFSVSYTANSNVKKELHRLEKSGMTVLVRTNDPNISEEMFNAQYDLVDGFVRVINASSGRVFEKYGSVCVEKSPAYIVHCGNAESFISAMSACDKLCSLKSVLSILQIFAVIIGMAMTAVLAVYGCIAQLNTLSLLLYQGVWSAIILLIARLRK